MLLSRHFDLIKKATALDYELVQLMKLLASKIYYREGSFAVDVSGNYRMFFEGYDKNDQQSVEKDKIVTVQITSIEDYH